MADIDVFDEIKKILEQNGSITQSTKDRMILMAISELHNEVRDVADLSKRVDNLERRNIVLWVNQHPKLAVTLAVALLFFLDFYFNSGFKDSILKIIGF